MLKNESARNVTKLVPLCLSRLPDSSGIFTFSNELRMEKISHFFRKFKQVKKGMTVQSVQSMCHADCADRMVHIADVEISDDDTWHLQEATHVRHFWTYGQPVGPI
jgi:hypothetical protein